MQMEIRGHIKPTDAIRAHLDKRLTSALNRFASHIRQISVRLDDTNGPGHGGPDKQCHIEVILDTGRRVPVVSEAVHQDLYTAISQVADRISEAVSREVDRVHHNHDHRKS